jgi:hypothetical protein
MYSHLAVGVRRPGRRGPLEAPTPPSFSPRRTARAVACHNTAVLTCAHHHVAAGGGQAVKQRHRQARTSLLDAIEEAGSCRGRQTTERAPAALTVNDPAATVTSIGATHRSHFKYEASIASSRPTLTVTDAKSHQILGLARSSSRRAASGRAHCTTRETSARIAHPDGRGPLGLERSIHSGASPMPAD